MASDRAQPRVSESRTSTAAMDVQDGPWSPVRPATPAESNVHVHVQSS